MRALATALMIAGLGMPVSHAHDAPPKTKEAAMTKRASGPFDVKLLPQPADVADQDPNLARLLLDKLFHGDLEAVSKGTMLSAATSVAGSAGYVAMEKVTGTLGGRKGSFVLQHSATMDRGAPSLSITVVPDSGTHELIGLTGRMTIEIAPGGKHSYAFEYSLP